MATRCLLYKFQSPSKKLPRLILVFWFWIFVNIVVLIFASITCDFGYFLIRFFKAVIIWFPGINCVDFSGRGKVFLVFLLVLPVLFFLLLSFLKSFIITCILRNYYFLSLKFEFFNLKIFYRAIWGAGFGYIGIN